MKKILLNAYINLNFGDDLFLKILFDRYSDVKWILPKGGQKYKSIFRNYNNVEIKDDFIFRVKNKFGIKEKNSVFNKYDAGLYIGGSIFMQLPTWKTQLDERKEVIGSFHKKNKPYFILGSNFGPYTEDKFVEEYKNLLEKCEDICFRDKYSYNIFKDFNNVRLAPDIVFQLKPRNLEKIENSIGISLIDVSKKDNLKKYRKDYINKFKDIIEEGIKLNKNFTFFSFCEAQGDLSIINELLDNIDIEYKSSIKVVNYTGDIDKFLMEFERMENIIGTRFHACILSQVFNQGLYPIIYSEKTYNVLKDIKLDKEYVYIKDISSLNSNHLFNVISKNKITDISIFKEAEKQFEGLDRYVSSN